MPSKIIRFCWFNFEGQAFPLCKIDTQKYYLEIKQIKIYFHVLHIYTILYLML